MVIFLYTIVFLILCFISHRKFNKIYNIVSLFAFIWCLFGSLSSLDLIGLRSPSNLIHGYALLFIIITSFGIFLFCNKRQYEKNITSDSNIFAKDISTQIEIVALMLFIPTILQSVTVLIAYGSLDAVRQSYFAINGFERNQHYLISFFTRMIPSGLFAGLNVFYAYKILTSYKHRYLFWCIINIVIEIFVKGGRTGIMLILIIFFVTLTLSNVSLSTVKRQAGNSYKYLKFFIVFIVTTIVFVTEQRGGSLIKSFVSYYSGSLSFLDYIVENRSEYQLDDHLYGYLTFSFIFEPIVFVLKVLGVTTAKIPSYYFNIVCQKFVDIGNANTQILFNNNTTVLYHYLRDFGGFGILIGSLLYSKLISVAYNGINPLRRNFELSALIYVYIGSTLINTIMTYQFYSVEPLFVFVVFYLCTRKNKKYYYE